MSIKCGYQIVTTAGGAAILTAGRPVIVYGVNMSGAGSSTSLYNGQTGSGTDVEVVVALSTLAGETVNFKGGIVFPLGCWADNNDDDCTVLYKTV